MKLQTLVQHILSAIIGMYLLTCGIGLWYHFNDRNWMGLIVGLLFILFPGIYFILEESK